MEELIYANKKGFTTVSVYRETKQLLLALKTRPNQSMNTVIVNLINRNYELEMKLRGMLKEDEVKPNYFTS